MAKREGADRGKRRASGTGAGVSASSLGRQARPSADRNGRPSGGTAGASRGNRPESREPRDNRNPGRGASSSGTTAARPHRPAPKRVESATRKSGSPAAPKAPERTSRVEDRNKASLLHRISPRIAIIAVLVIAFGVFAFGPTMRNLEANAELRRKERALALEKTNTAKLQAELKEAESLSYVEEEARKQRLVIPGEVLYLITSEKDGSEIEYRVKSIQSMDEAWERVRLMLNCGKPRSSGGTK